MPNLLEIPEIVGLDWRQSLVRIPADLDVPLTPRVRRLIDTPEFQRLKRISQLGLVGKVYPAANHTRFEHSLGVYRLALLLLKQLAHDARFSEAIGAKDAELFIVAALLHDLGHRPFCHLIEDLKLPRVPSHESASAHFLFRGELADVLKADWKIDARAVYALLAESPRDRVGRLLSSMLSGPIDIDKMDYLYRDSLHAGVPYGRNFDQNRLIGSLCLNAAGDGLAISSKGKTAAELMVFARYVMFSEVYWHHCVRAATAMLQRIFSLVYEPSDAESFHLRHDEWMEMGDTQWIDSLRKAAEATPAAELLDRLFGHSRRIYKRVAEFTVTDHPELYRQVAGRPYAWLSACGARLAELASRRLGTRVGPNDLLIDAPPQDREVQFKVDIYYAKQDRYRPLADVSPVVRVLAEEQFDDYVKKVRVFGDPAIAAALRELARIQDLLHAAVEETTS